MSKRTRRVFLVLVTMALCAGGGSDAWASSGAVFGYGTVAVENGRECVSPPTTPQDTLFNGARCKSLSGDFCETIEFPRLSTTTCRANVKAVPGSDGWKFAGWSGGCDGSQETCEAVVSTQDCRQFGDVRTCDPVVFKPAATARFVDVQPPIVTFTSGPREDEVVASNAARFEWSVSQPEEQPSFACSLDGGQTSCDTDITGLANGPHSFAVTATDPSRQQATTTRRWTVDSVAPTVTLTAPAAGGARRGVVQLTASASDQNGVDHVEFAVRGVLVARDTTAPYTFAWDSTTVTDGAAAVTAVSFDRAGNMSPASSATITVDNTVPAVTVTTPGASAVYPRLTSVLANYRCTDAAGGSGISLCTGTVANGSAIDTATRGAKTFTVTATDAAGNTTSRVVNYTVSDGTAPTASHALSPPPGAAGWNTADVTVGISAVDDIGGAGVRQIDLQATGAQPTGPITTPGNSASMLVHTDGQTTITYTATDNSGNTSTAKTVTVKLDKRAPAATVTSPAEGAAYQPGAALNAGFTCADPAGGSGLATCVGDVSNGAAIDTRTPGKKTFTVTATDTAGNRTVRTVNYSVGDTVAPVLDVPSTVTGRATEDSGTPVTYEVSARDAVDGTVAANCSPASGSVFAIGTTAVTCTAVDRSGNEATRGFDVTVSDGVAPTVALTSPTDGSTALAYVFSGSAGTAAGDDERVVVHVFAGTEAAGTPQQTLTATRTAGGLFVVAPDPPLAPGAYVATAEQADASGNLGRSAAVGFTVSTIVRSDDGPAVPDAAPDGDRDGVPDVTDNCPEVSNAGQADIDADRLGDACDLLPPGDSPPVAGVSMLVQATAGEVFVRLPSSGTRGLRQAASFVPLKGIAALPIGTEVDTRKGTISLQTAGNGYDPASARAQRQQATLSAAMFKIRQARVLKGVAKSAAIPTDLALQTPPEATRACVGSRPLKGAVRALSATVKGYYRTIAGASTTTARNATFNVSDRCEGTLTEVGRGKVAVAVKGRKKPITVTAGHAYLVRAQLFSVRKGRKASRFSARAQS